MVNGLVTKAHKTNITPPPNPPSSNRRYALTKRASTSSGRRSSHTNGTSTSARSKLSSTGGITIRSPSPQQVSRGRAAVPSEDSATGSAFDAFSPNLRPLSGRRGGRGVGRGELVAGAGKTDGSRANGSSREGGEAEGGVGGFRDTVPEMDDQERSMLLGLLSGAYDQVVLLFGFVSSY